MFTAKTAVAKIRKAKPTTFMTLTDEQNDIYEMFTEADWAKRKTVAHFHVPEQIRPVYAGDLVGDDIKGIGYDDMFFAVNKVKKVNLIEVRGTYFLPEQIKQFKKTRVINILAHSLDFSYPVTIAVTGMKIGCQDRTWQEWEDYLTGGAMRWLADAYEAEAALREVLEIRAELIAKLTVKKTVAKKAVKKVAKKAVAKKTTKRR